MKRPITLLSGLIAFVLCGCASVPPQRSTGEPRTEQIARLWPGEIRISKLVRNGDKFSVTVSNAYSNAYPTPVPISPLDLAIALKLSIYQESHSIERWQLIIKNDKENAEITLKPGETAIVDISKFIDRPAFQLFNTHLIPSPPPTPTNFLFFGGWTGIWGGYIVHTHGKYSDITPIAQTPTTSATEPGTGEEKTLAGVDPTLTSTDADYGYSQKKPIKVGSKNEYGGPSAEEAYLRTLRDERGQPVTFKRIGSSGPGPEGHTLDGFEVQTSTGRKLDLYIDMYHPKSDPKKQPAPKGLFKAK